MCKSALVEQIKRLIIVLDNVLLATLGLSTLGARATKHIIVRDIRTSIRTRIGTVDCIVVLALELALGLLLCLLVLTLASVSPLLAALTSLANVGNEFTIAFRTIALDQLRTKATDHALENVLYLCLEVLLVLVTPDNKVGHQTLQTGQHELRRERDDTDLDETED